MMWRYLLGTLVCAQLVASGRRGVAGLARPFWTRSPTAPHSDHRRHQSPLRRFNGFRANKGLSAHSLKTKLAMLNRWRQPSTTPPPLMPSTLLQSELNLLRSRLRGRAKHRMGRKTTGRLSQRPNFIHDIVRLGRASIAILI